MSKVIKCKTCGAEIASSAKTCPSCGAKNKKPIYKKWWFWAIIAIVLIAAISSGGNDSSASNTNEGNLPVDSSAPSVEYITCNATDLFDALAENAMKASDTYKGKYVEVTGYLSVIDSSGKYIGIGADEDNYDYVLQSITCNIKSDEQREFIKDLVTNDKIVIKGKISDVGEVLGYTMNIESITLAD